ncbi:MAG: RNA polymerase sigma factor [Alphaproteobacteria bacterium]|nr:RNA polymerase sigma factor [Alphaproteobacteria bacterium]
MQDNEIDLMRKIAKGDAKSFQELFALYERPVFNYVWRMTTNISSAEDITQDVFLKVWKNASSWKPDYQLKTWLYKIAYTTYVDKFRSEKITTELPENLIDNSLSLEQECIQQEQQKRVENAVKTLPKQQRHALVLCYYQGLKAKEIAEIMNMKTNAVEVMIHRAKQTLKELLGENHG